MTYVPHMPVTQLLNIPWSRSSWTRLVEDFWFYSDVLGEWVCINAPFDFDWESVPVLKGTSRLAGLVHDYLSRKDSTPRVSKKVAADVYLEMMKYRGTPAIRRNIKYTVVRVWPGYFHKKSVNWHYRDLETPYDC